MFANQTGAYIQSDVASTGTGVIDRLSSVLGRLRDVSAGLSAQHARLYGPPPAIPTTFTGNTKSEAPPTADSMLGAILEVTSEIESITSFLGSRI